MARNFQQGDKVDTTNPLVMQLASLRDIKQQTDLQISEIHTEVQDRHSALFARSDRIRAELSVLEGLVRESALEAFGATGDKKPFGGVSIRQTVDLQYDEKDAIEYCRATAETASVLKLDKVKFKKIATALSLPFVKTTTVPAASIATDLSGFLPANES